jgi:hypothetical protein
MQFVHLAVMLGTITPVGPLGSKLKTAPPTLAVPPHMSQMTSTTASTSILLIIFKKISLQ